MSAAVNTESGGCPDPLYLFHVIRDYLRRCGGIGMARKRYSDENVLNLLRQIEFSLASGISVETACWSALTTGSEDI
jgi:hypothetical protein